MRVLAEKVGRSYRPTVDPLDGLSCSVECGCGGAGVDFKDGLDQIEIVSGAETFADLDITAQNNNALVSFGAVVLVLEDIAPGALSTDDFVFS